jgi:hypothetical protein
MSQRYFASRMHEFCIIRPKWIFLKRANISYHPNISLGVRDTYPQPVFICVFTGIMFVSILWSVCVIASYATFLHFQLTHRENNFVKFSFHSRSCFVISGKCRKTTAETSLIWKVRTRRVTVNSTFSSSPHLILHCRFDLNTGWRRVFSFKFSCLSLRVKIPVYIKQEKQRSSEPVWIL